jgi:hypothetical protein
MCKKLLLILLPFFSTFWEAYEKNFSLQKSSIYHFFILNDRWLIRPARQAAPWKFFPFSARAISHSNSPRTVPNGPNDPLPIPYWPQGFSLSFQASLKTVLLPTWRHDPLLVVFCKLLLSLLFIVDILSR